MAIDIKTVKEAQAGQNNVVANQRVAFLKAVDDLVAPVWMGPGGGTTSFYSFRDESLMLTSLYEKDGQVWARGYKLPSRSTSTLRDFQIFNRPVRELE